MKKTKLITIVVCLLLGLSFYFIYDNNSSLGMASAEESQNNNSGDSMFLLFKPKCRDAISSAKYLNGWDASYNKGAKTASQMFDNHLHGKYDSMRFVTSPVLPYYFIKAHIERELSCFGIVNIDKGVIDRNDPMALEEFIKYIHIINTTETARHLAEMIHCFHAGVTMRLVTEYEAEDWRAEQNEPKLTKNEDGSVTLVYDLINTGRSNAVKQCTLKVTSDYKISLECIEKQKKNK